MFRSELEFVRWLQSHPQKPGPATRLGIGDDGAVVRVGRNRDLILTADLLIDGVHFLSSIHPARSVGHRALARSLSDIAAMGGTPRYALISLAISQSTSRKWIEDFYAGVFALAQRFKAGVIGGDTAVVRGRLFADVTVAGEVTAGGEIRRSGAQPGDQVLVSGQLGLSALGLRLLRSGRSQSIGAAEAVKAHLYPEPRCALGRYLSDRRLATSMIDLSDGLSSDLTRLLEANGVGARIFADRIPTNSQLYTKGLRGHDALELALNGGEDYELLFTVPKRLVRRLPASFRGIPITRIGEIRRSKSLVLITADGTRTEIEGRGFDHFRRRRRAGR